MLKPKISILAACIIILSFVGYVPSIAQDRTDKSFDELMKELGEVRRSMTITGDARCSKCPEACETVCDSPSNSRCVDAARRAREEMFARCKKQGRL